MSGVKVIPFSANTSSASGVVGPLAASHNNLAFIVSATSAVIAF